MSDALKRAVRDALGTYLQGQLAAAYPQLVVSGEWPTPGVPLPPQAITVVTPGDPEIEYHPALEHIVTPTTGVNGTSLYSYGVVSQGLQLDVWAQFAATRDDLSRDLEAAINRPSAVTMQTPSLPRYLRGEGLVIPLPSLYSIPCDFRFKAVPTIDEQSDAAQQGEWRATFTGTAFCHLVNQETVALMKHILLTVNGEQRDYHSP